MPRVSNFQYSFIMARRSLVDTFNTTTIIYIPLKIATPLNNIVHIVATFMIGNKEYIIIFIPG